MARAKSRIVDANEPGRCRRIHDGAGRQQECPTTLRRQLQQDSTRSAVLGNRHARNQRIPSPDVTGSATRPGMTGGAPGEVGGGTVTVPVAEVVASMIGGYGVDGLFSHHERCDTCIA
jgi:hypothetical protein